MPTIHLFILHSEWPKLEFLAKTRVLAILSANGILAILSANGILAILSANGILAILSANGIREQLITFFTINSAERQHFLAMMRYKILDDKWSLRLFSISKNSPVFTCNNRN